MYANSVDKTGVKRVRKFLFEDSDMNMIPAKEGWNEGYPDTNKYLYVNSISPAVKQKAEKVGLLATVD